MSKYGGYIIFHSPRDNVKFDLTHQFEGEYTFDSWVARAPHQEKVLLVMMMFLEIENNFNNCHGGILWVSDEYEEMGILKGLELKNVGTTFWFVQTTIWSILEWLRAFSMHR